MSKRILIVLALILMTGTAYSEQKPKTEPRKKPVLSEEEKEILKNRELLENMDLLRNLDKFRTGKDEKDIIGNREILENMDLLQDFEKFRFYQLFAGEAEPDGTAAREPAAQKDEKKK